MQVTFSRPVEVDTTGGTPTLGLGLRHQGSSVLESLDYVSGSGTENLVFEYTVKSSDMADEGVGTAGEVELNGGKITSLDGLDALLTGAALSLDAGHLVDGSASEAVVMVSNIGQAASSGTNDLVTRRWAQRLGTGAHDTGYVLSTVEVKFSTMPTNVSVKLMRGSSIGGAVEVATLTNPDSLVAGDLTFTVPSKTLLERSTHYWVVVEADAGTLARTLSTDEDQGGLGGWTIHRNSQQQVKATSVWSSLSAALMIRLNGTENPGTRPSQARRADDVVHGGASSGAGLERAERYGLGGLDQRLRPALLRRNQQPRQRGRLGHRGRGRRPGRPRNSD